MRIPTFIGVLLVTMATTGCLVVPKGGSSSPSERTGRSSSASSKAGKDCPPGHTWSDGQCHDKGKGHDPNHKGKGQDKNKNKNK
jgi:hypothetical protein